MISYWGPVYIYKYIFNKFFINEVRVYQDVYHDCKLIRQEIFL
jgi:hypothetical protein